ncbi:MAG: sugar ABC transporter permease [Clostridia bacterium]
MTVASIKPLKQKSTGKEKWRKITPYLYIAPSLILFILFIFYPFTKTLYLSLNLTDQAGAAIRFIGLENYATVLHSKDFWFSLGVSFKFAAMVVIGTLILSTFCALIANESFRGRGFVRTVFAMPMAVSSACIAVICTFILHPTSMGVMNYILGTSNKWLKDFRLALPSVAGVTIWMNIGMNYIFIIAALQNVDHSLYEAAAIEGVNTLQKHWHITLPSISPTVFFLLIIDVIGSFQSYAQINLMTQGGPGKYTRVIVYQIYWEAFRSNRYGTAATMSVLLFFVLLILTVIQFRVEKKVTY